MDGDVPSQVKGEELRESTPHAMLSTRPSSHTHANFTAILPGETGLSVYSVTLPINTSCLTASHHVVLRQEKGRW